MSELVEAADPGRAATGDLGVRAVGLVLTAGVGAEGVAVEVAVVRD